MKVVELLEQVPIGSTPFPAAGGSTVPPTSGTAPQAAPIGVAGNTQQLQDPKMQAAQLAKQKQEKDKQKKAIQDQIAALQKQLTDLNRVA